MPISSKGFARVSLALIIVGVLALIGIVGTTIWLVERTQVYFEEVVQAREARGAAVELRNLLQDAQSGQRGYLLTLDPSYLEPYEAAVGAIEGAYNRLVASLAAFPQTEEPLQALSSDIDTKRTELARTIELAGAGELGQAIAIVRTDAGEAIMSRIRQVLDSVIETSDMRIFNGVIEQRGAANALRIIALIGALVIVGVVGGAAWVVLRYTRELDTARDEVEMLNRDLEKRVAERTVDLRRANEEVQRFAYIVTHDLRAPLVNIMGFTSELEAALGPINALVESHGENPDDPVLAEARQTAQEDLPEAIGFIRSSTRKMDGLINAILKISREGRRELKSERLDLAELVEGAVAAVRHQIDETGGEVTIDVSTPPVFSDRLALEQILGNLLDNAIKYRHPDRPIDIAVKGRQERDGRIVIDVRDNGRGIAPEDHERVFELFRRSGNQTVPGEGIGLAHVRIMARNLGGDIELQSNRDHGTTFTVIIAPDLRVIARSKALS
ncbi:CHASE3 domain-containing protein [Pelagibacterium sp. 26DY04]|uniref:sensor histidine kinase n=1 Tax=Pelagibacterium sp. 26DY04 TaxID=2967130 RepID=UPI0028169BBF|nr:CHASE3 domain-containing protein [Pelagibacterium sp. 26DY04]WMT87389.1 CHASE3 domain-containing protein [Pelagibacterium sp. 26DY04]